MTPYQPIESLLTDRKESMESSSSKTQEPLISKKPSDPKKFSINVPQKPIPKLDHYTKLSPRFVKKNVKDKPESPSTVTDSYSLIKDRMNWEYLQDSRSAIGILSKAKLTSDDLPDNQCQEMLHAAQHYFLECRTNLAESLDRLRLTRTYFAIPINDLQARRKEFLTELQELEQKSQETFDMLDTSYGKLCKECGDQEELPSDLKTLIHKRTAEYLKQWVLKFCIENLQHRIKISSMAQDLQKKKCEMKIFRKGNTMTRLLEVREPLEDLAKLLLAENKFLKERYKIYKAMLKELGY